MHPRPDQPIHALGAVMDRVESPENRDLVEQAAPPILHEIGHDHDFDKLQDQRLHFDLA
jgi:predicted Zn-dependent protease with MMP-like domain